jgi:hypothetical protein
MTHGIAYLDGWYAEEHDGAQPFRWMAAAASCRIGGPSGAGPAWLRVTARHTAPSAPALSVSVNGRSVGSHTLSPGTSPYLFPIDGGGPAEGNLDVTLAVDRTFRAPGDDRDLGVMIYALDVLVPDPADAEGWYEWERGDYFPWRWMGIRATVAIPPGRGRFASFAACPQPGVSGQILSVLADSAPVADLRLLDGWHLYDLTLPAASQSGSAAGPVLTLVLDRLAPAASHPSDPRDLGVRVGEIERHDDARRHARAQTFYDWAIENVVPGRADRSSASRRAFGGADRGHDDYLPEDAEGWHEWELQDEIPFRWMGLEARARVPADIARRHRFCTIPVFSEVVDASQVVTIHGGGLPVVELGLAHCWNFCTFAVPPVDGDQLTLVLRVNRLLPASAHPEDARTLGVRVGPFRFHDWDERGRDGRLMRENAELNQREMNAGATVLASFPTKLGIDLHARCNISPACVYCPWDEAKQAEGDDAGAVIDDSTLEGYGALFDAALSFVNCSFGEPLLHPRLDEVLGLFDRRDKLVELSTNGQAFTPATVGALAGRRVALYVSLDSGTGETYSHLRNDRWTDVLTGLIALSDARRLAHGQPRLNMVFMPMRANVSDLESYFRLCRMIEADALVLRPLLPPGRPGVVVERGGYRFDYDRELLGRDELDAVFRRSEELSRTYGVAVASQFDFGLPRSERTVRT